MLFHSLPTRRQSKIIRMECLHGKHALATTTKNGLFWYCGNKPSCQFFCPQKDRDIFARAVTSFQASGCPQPVCSAHQRLAKMRVVKDNTKGNAGRSFFVCSNRENPCSFWEWGDRVEIPRPTCQHGLVCRVRKVKKEGNNLGRLFYCCPNQKETSCGFFEWKPIEDSNDKRPRGSNINDHPRVERLCCLFSSPLQYKYRVSDTGLTFQSRREDPNEAFAEYIGELPNLSITDLTEGWTPELKENN